MKTIAERWALFERTVIPLGAPKNQRTEMRRAFYMGFWSCLHAGLEMADESGDDDAKGAAMIQALHTESQEFRDRVAAGKA